MRILILGAGGIGGYMGGRLVAAGGDVTFLVRPARAERLRTDGLRIDSPLGNVSSPVKTRTADEAAASFDVVVIACKSFDLDNAVASVKNSVGEGTAIIPFLNGVSHIDRLKEAFPQARILGGVAHISVTLRDDGVIQHMSPLCRFRVGAFKEAPSDVPEKLAELMNKAGLETTVVPTIAQELWDKFVFLTTLAGMTSLMRAAIGDILATPAGEKLVRQLLDECTAVAAAEGFKPGPNNLATYLGMLTEKGSAFKASMARDVERGLPTEADHIVVDMLKRGTKHGLSLPLLEIAATHLQTYDVVRKKAA